MSLQGLLLRCGLLMLIASMAIADASDDPDDNTNTDPESATETPAPESPPVSADGPFVPTERLRWDQEVDYPTDI